MLGSILSSPRSALSAEQMLGLANAYLNNARQTQDSYLAAIFFDDAEISLSQAKQAFKKAFSPETLADQTLRNKIGTTYFERGQVLDQLGQPDRAQASYKKAQKWGHPGLAPQSSILSAGAALPLAALTNRPIIAAQTSDTLHAPAPLSAVNPSSAISADTPSTLAEPVQNAALSPHILEGIQEKNDLVNQLFTETLETFQSLDLSSVWPSAFLVYAHDNPHYGMADAGTAKFLIDHLVKLGVNLYSDQRPKGLQAPAALLTREDAARVDDILTSQLCLLPTAIGGVQPVDKVIVCGSQVLGHYLQWGEAGKHYQTYCTDLKKAYGLAQQNPAQAEAEIRQVVNTYSQHADFHHVLTEMAFLKIRADYLDQHGIIPISLCANGSKLCVQDFVKATTVRIEDMPRFASQQASGQAVYQHQGRHLVFFKLLERLLAQNGAEALLRTFWTAYADLIKRLNSEASVPKAAEYVRVWGQISQNVRDTLQALRTQVNAHELQTALTRYASLDRLAIQRLSGPPLSMKHCYINLAIVEHEKARKEEKKPKEGEAAQNHFHRLPSVEAIDSNQQKLVSLEKLFDPRKLSDGKTVAPKRILIRGRAGVGKTTLSKKIVYEYTQKAQWRDRFDWLFWIPLRTLKGKSSCDLSTLFHETYFQSHPNGQALAKALETHISGPAKDKTLFVLDGWDEIAQEWGEHEPMSEFLKQLLNQPAVLITSRPYVDLGQADPMELELETVGFSLENVTAYLNNPGIVSTAEGKEIKHFIQANPFIHELINVPVQLDALCYSWDEIKRMQKEVPGAMTITALYQAMMNKLWRKDILRLDKWEEGKPLTASQVNAIESPSHIERLVEVEQSFLGALAFKGLQNNQIEFSRHDLRMLIGQFETQGVGLPVTLEANLKKLSFLHADDAEESRRSYHFMHLTFQEFFAAKFLVRHLQAHADAIRQPLSTEAANINTQLGINPSLEELASVIATHKYNSRYEIVWWMVAGLLKDNTLEHFFTLLEESPRDLIGIRHQQVMMRCLNEARVQLNPATISKLERELMQWLDFEMKYEESGHSRLGCQRVFPEHLLIQHLSQPKAKKDEVIKTLGARPALSSEAILVLLSASKDENGYVRSAAASVLANQRERSADAILILLSALKDEDRDIRSAAARALDSQHPLAADAISALLLALRDENSDVRFVAASALGNQRELSIDALSALLFTLKDEEWRVRSAAANALGKQRELSSEVVLALLSALKDKKRDARTAAENALNHQHSLSTDAVLALLSALKEEEWYVRYAAASALGKQRELSSDAVLALLSALKDKKRSIRSKAVHALGKQRELSYEVVLALLSALKDKDSDLRSEAASALGGQRELLSEVVLALLSALKDKDWYVRCATASALGNQRELPAEVVLALLSALKDEEEYVRRAAVRALSNQRELPSEVVLALLSTLKDEDRDIRSAAVSALGKQRELSSEIVLALLSASKDKEWDVRTAAASALGKQRELPAEVVLTLLAALRDEEKYVRRAAVRALSNQRELPSEVVLALLSALKDKEGDVRSAAVSALGNQRGLSADLILALLSALKDKEEDVRSAAVRALGKQRELPAEVVLALLSASKDKEWNVRTAAASALGKQRELPTEVVLTLLAALRDKEGDVRSAAAKALGNQHELPSEVVLALLSTLQDRHRDVHSEAAKALIPYINRLFTLLPRIKRDQIKVIYTQVFLPRGAEQIPSLYIQDNQLYFFTAMGPKQPIKLNAYQIKEITEAFRAVQVEAGITSRLKRQWQWFW